MNKLSGIIRAFCRTITEYRKEMVGDRKADIAKAVLYLQTAQAQQLGGMRMSDFYKMMRESMGAADAGR
jgi:hypothetical protein